jgi:hypothetical protein
MARDGIGVAAIAKALNADKVPIMGVKLKRGKPVTWSAPTVYFVLTTTTTVGEYVPHRGTAKPGNPVTGYFPPVIDANTYHVVQAALRSRGRVGRGRRGKHLNLLSGLLKDWRDGGSLSYWHVGKHPAKIVSVNAKEGKGIPWVSFPAVALERAIRSQLAEVKASDIDGKKTTNKLDALKAERDELQALVTAWEAKMDDVRLVDKVAAKLAELYAKQSVNTAALAEAEQLTATPLTESWKEAATLAGLNPDDDTDKRRQRIRAALRRCIESITCLFVPTTGRDRLAIVRVRFMSGGVRVYVVWNQQPRAGIVERTPGQWWAHSHPARNFDMGNDSPARTITGIDLFGEPYTEKIPAKKGSILSPGFVLPDDMAKRFREFAQGEGHTSGELK